MIDFYDRIPPFTRFSDVMDDSHYRIVPEDWIVILTDIQGSTKAIQENRYKDVNLLGAASITAILNRLKGIRIPFVFGGDGATVLIHESHLQQIIPALEATRRLGRESFGLEIRIGIVPVREVIRAGGLIEVAKFSVSPKTSFAMIRGGGLTLAEKLVKAKSSENRFLLDDRSHLGPEILNSAFEGLSCRWNPVRSKRGEMLSLLVLATNTNEDPKQLNQVYREVVAEIDQILSHDSEPLTSDKFDRRFNLQNLFKEIQIHEWNNSIIGKTIRLLGALGGALAMAFFVKTKIRLGTFSAESYVRDIAANSDTKKFDDLLRMVRDCSEVERRQIEAYLERERQAGRLVYGLHASKTAMFTCLVFQLDDHMHFVDGGDGGYTLAAQQLKEQLRTQN